MEFEHSLGLNNPAIWFQRSIIHFIIFHTTPNGITETHVVLLLLLITILCFKFLQIEEIKHYPFGEVIKFQKHTLSFQFSLLIFY